MNQSLMIAMAMVLAFAAWQYQRAERLRESMLILERSLSEQKATIDYQQNLATKQAQMLSLWGDREEKIRERTRALEAEINALRTTEYQRSLAAPFETGNDAYDRRRAILMRIADKEDRGPDSSGRPGDGGAGGTGSP